MKLIKFATLNLYVLTSFKRKGNGRIQNSGYNITFELYVIFWYLRNIAILTIQVD